VLWQQKNKPKKKVFYRNRDVAQSNRLSQIPRPRFANGNPTLPGNRWGALANISTRTFPLVFRPLLFGCTLVSILCKIANPLPPLYRHNPVLCKLCTFSFFFFVKAFPILLFTTFCILHVIKHFFFRFAEFAGNVRVGCQSGKISDKGAKPSSAFLFNPSPQQ
jgi:hypothetical protein